MEAFRTTADYSAGTDDPLEFRKGDVLIVGEEFNGNPLWKGWIRCRHTISGKEGWVPRQLLEIQEKEGIALFDYSGRELTAKKGITLVVIKSMNGWSWCRTENGHEGWLPDEVIGK